MLAESLDYETTLANVVRAAVPTFGDLCFVYLAQPDSTLRRTIALHSNPAKQAIVDELGQRYPIAQQQQHPVNQAARDGRSLLLTRDMWPMLDTLTVDERHMHMLRSVRPTSQTRSTLCSATARSSRSGRAWRAATSRWRRASRSVGSMAREVRARGLHCARLRPHGRAQRTRRTLPRTARAARRGAREAHVRRPRLLRRPGVEGDDRRAQRQSAERGVDGGRQHPAGLLARPGLPRRGGRRNGVPDRRCGAGVRRHARAGPLCDPAPRLRQLRRGRRARG